MNLRSKPTKTTAQSLDQQATDDVTKYFAHVKPLTLAGTTYTPAVLEAEIAANKAVDENEAQLRQQVVAAKLARAKALAARTGLKAYILGNSGADAVQMLTDFGIPVPKSRGPRTARSKALAVDSHRHAQGKEGGDRVDPCARPLHACAGGCRGHAVDSLTRVTDRQSEP
jgi:hypothetical protein